MHPIICDATRAKRLIRFVCEGDERIVEPHSGPADMPSRAFRRAPSGPAASDIDTEPLPPAA